MKARESGEAAILRHRKLQLLQKHYEHFIPFLHDVMELLGFSTSDVQEDIANYLEFGPQYLMIQAQRGQAKTTITAGFAVWDLIHHPHHRVLILSAGGTQAVEISTLIVRIIMTMDVLECLRPDRAAGDRESVEAFDVHHTLKGLDKSPSVACVGIDANLQGKRADLLIPDDIESQKNSATSVQRAKLSHLMKDFTSICSRGRILYLGTPQSIESVYNQLPALGVHLRIWPGRYPTQKQMEFYGQYLAPMITARIAGDPSLQYGGGFLGDQGQAIDPLLLPEDVLVKKELLQGTPYFQLQHMLNTTLNDAMRFPLKPEYLVVMSGVGSRYPLSITRGTTNSTIEQFMIADFTFRMQNAQDVSPEVQALPQIRMYIDPAAGGTTSRDETAWAIGGLLNGNVVVRSAGGVPGGYDLDKMKFLVDLMLEHKPTVIIIEKNMGFGAFREVIIPLIRAAGIVADIQDDMVSGMKERRIIQTLAPVMGRGSLVIDRRVIEEDAIRCAGYPAAERQTYSLFFQLAKMTEVRQALVHDDRADALEGLVRSFQKDLAQDQAQKLAVVRKREHEIAMRDPLGHNRYKPYAPTNSRFHSMLSQRKRRGR